MTGVKGAGGPVPKRADRRLGHTSRASRARVTQGAATANVEVPEADPEWHPVAARWYESIGKSGQACFYEPSDWGAAYLIAESISRELNPRPMVVGHGKDAEIEMVSLPPTAASLAAWLKGMTALMATEGDRRRLRLELERPEPERQGSGNVSWLDSARRGVTG